MDADDPLRLMACPRCDYRLDGLPAAGVCPECGRAYGPDVVVLYGTASGVRADEWTRPPTTARQLCRAWLWGVPVTGVVFGLVVLGDWPRPIGGAILLLGFVRLAVATARATVGTGSGVVQVRLGPGGVYQGVRGGGPLPYAKADDAALSPWSAVRQIDVEVGRGGLIHVVVTSGAGDRPVVDAVVVGTPAAAAELSRRVAVWRRTIDQQGAGDRGTSKPVDPQGWRPP